MLAKAAREAAREAGIAPPPVALDISDGDGPTGDSSRERLDAKSKPLKFVSSKSGAGVTLTHGGAVAASAGAAVGAQLGDTWMAGGRNPLVWTCALVLEEVAPDTLVGVVGRNYFPSAWDGEAPLARSSHAVVLRCGDGSIKHKGKGTSFILRPIASGARLQLVLDMQKLEMTIELLSKADGPVLSSVTVEGVPSEVTLAVGFAAGGAPQRVRLVGCTSEKPEMVLLGKLRKDLWDDDNVQKPLPLNVKEKERGPQQMHDAEIAIAASMES